MKAGNIVRILSGIPTAELAHEACNYASHNKVCPLSIVQTLRRQVERDTERMEKLTREAASCAELLKAGKALVERWNTPLWKDVPHTGEFIHNLRAAIDKVEALP